MGTVFTPYISVRCVGKSGNEKYSFIMKTVKNLNRITERLSMVAFSKLLTPYFVQSEGCNRKRVTQSMVTPVSA